MQVHKILQRQFARTGLNVDCLPVDIQQWHNFIERVNKIYNDYDEERYLIERSIELSSRKIKELNEKNENAQHIAGIGYWHFDSINDVIVYSEELRNILNFSIEEALPKFSEVLSAIHKEDVDKFKFLIERAIEKGDKFETEMQIIPNKSKDYKWLYIVGAPYHCDKSPYTQLSGICMDITTRKQAELKISNLQQELLDSARKIGMSDVASSILHNVGNVLNSANVSVSIMNETFEKNIL